MTELPLVQAVIAYVAIGCAVLNFLVYLAFSWKALTADRTKIEDGVHKTFAAIREMALPNMEQLADALKALASLVESLVKAGPALWAMIGSALFLLIAALAAGVFGGA